MVAFETICRSTNAIEHAHIRDVDYNPKKQHIVVSVMLFTLNFISRTLIVIGMLNII